MCLYVQWEDPKEIKTSGMIEDKKKVVDGHGIEEVSLQVQKLDNRQRASVSK